MTRLAALLLGTVSLLSASTSFLPSRISLASSQGFCPIGADPSTAWPEGKPDGLHVWGSYCDAAKNTGTAVTEPFPAPAHLRLYLSGYISLPGESLALENIADGSKIPIRPTEDPHENWLPYDFTLPSSWSGKSVRLVAQDSDNAAPGWIGFSEPLAEERGTPAWGDAGSLLLRTAVSLTLLMLPAFAVCACVVQRGERDATVAGLVTLAATGASGYLIFWVWFLSPRLGHLIAFLLPIAALACLIWKLKRMDGTGRAILKGLLVPALLVGAASLLILSTGFVYGGLRTPLETPRPRFSHFLPPDNSIPYRLTVAVANGQIPRPLLGSWNSSDRPPLQSGIVLAQYAYIWAPRALAYEVVSTLCQSLWILALWVCLRAFGVRPRAAALAVSVCLFSGFVFLNTFYVWPKLLAGAYSIGLFTAAFSGARHRTVLSITAGALLAFGLLSHGGALFAAIGLVLTAAALRKRLPFTNLTVILATAFVLYLPWLLYQKLFDPPGDRLLKYHLAGVENVDSRPALQAIRDAYSSLDSHQLLNNKWTNLMAATDHQNDYWSNVRFVLLNLFQHDAGQPARITHNASDARTISFFFFVPGLGFLIAGVPAVLIGCVTKRRSPEWKSAAYMWLFSALTILIWCLLMFGPSTTVIHQGSYAVNLLSYAGSVLALWALSPRLAWVVSGLQIALNFLLYVMYMRGADSGTILLEGQLHYGTLLLALLSLGLSGFLLRELSGEL